MMCISRCDVCLPVNSLVIKMSSPPRRLGWSHGFNRYVSPEEERRARRRRRHEEDDETYDDEETHDDEEEDEEQREREIQEARARHELFLLHHTWNWQRGVIGRDEEREFLAIRDQFAGILRQARGEEEEFQRLFADQAPQQQQPVVLQQVQPMVPARARGRPRAANAVRDNSGVIARRMRWTFTLRGNYPNGQPWQQLPRGIAYMSFQLERGSFSNLHASAQQVAEQQGLHVQGYLEADPVLYPNGLTSDEIARILGVRPNDFSYLKPSYMGRDNNQRYTNKQRTRVENNPHVLGARAPRDDEDPGAEERFPPDEGGRDVQQDRMEMMEMTRMGAPKKNTAAETWQNITDLARQGLSAQQIAMMFPREGAVYFAGIQRTVSLYNKNKFQWRENLKVYVLWGPTRTGKSYRVNKWFGPINNGRKMATKNSAKDYNDTLEEDTETYFFDEFEGKEGVDPSLAEIRKVCDIYPYLLNKKFGGCYAGYTTVVFCSNKNPFEWYPRDELAAREALWARFTKVWHVTSKDQYLEGWPGNPEEQNKVKVEVVE